MQVAEPLQPGPACDRPDTTQRRIWPRGPLRLRLAYRARIRLWIGNKRTAAVAGETVIVLNGAALLADDPELYGSYIGLADGMIEAPAFADCLRPPVQPRQQERIHPPAAHYRRGHGAGSLSRTLL
ncbi:type II toxin-antitoxin system death-on-curing family toxin [Xanthomonas arboricola pv. juglandis]|nr:type II toxin-antitoxin system death-on-curing family toxin [Xanthomonas arboricola pv. juglandis]